MKNNFEARSKFEDWVRKFGGTKRLSEVLGISQQTIQHWCAGRARPGVEDCYQMLQLSKGALTLKDIYEGTKDGLERN